MRWLLESKHGLCQRVLRPQLQVERLPGTTQHLGYCVLATKSAEYRFYICHNTRELEQERFLLWHLLLAFCHGSHV